ncbi:MAG: hypothetical protein HC880_00460 [Bacteroidia bacterium]|nr:hypothetical protein [Bacteroidia bacterium]
MKKLILIIGMLLIATNSYAGEYRHKSNEKQVSNPVNVFNEYDEKELELGAKLDAPYLVRFYKDWFIGVEGGKDTFHTNANEGWFAYGKVTYTGTWVNFAKIDND